MNRKEPVPPGLEDSETFNHCMKLHMVRRDTRRELGENNVAEGKICFVCGKMGALLPMLQCIIYNPPIEKIEELQHGSHLGLKRVIACGLCHRSWREEEVPKLVDCLVETESLRCQLCAEYVLPMKFERCHIWRLNPRMSRAIKLCSTMDSKPEACEIKWRRLVWLAQEAFFATVKLEQKRPQP